MEHAHGLDPGARRADHGPEPRRGRDHATYAAPGRRRRRPPAGAHRPLPRGQRGDRIDLRAGLRLRARARRVDDGGRRPPHRRRDRGGPDGAAANRHGDRHRGRPRPRAARREAGRPGLLLPLLVRGAGLAAGHRRGQRADGGHAALLARLARARPQYRPPLAPAHPALGPDDQGSHLHADRRHRGRAHHLVARDARRGAQLGLPLHVDARHDVHPPGAPLAPARLGGRRVHGVRGRSRGERGRRASDHVRDRRAARPHRVHARRAVRVHGSEPGSDRQRRLRPAPERRVRRRARLDPAAHPAQPATAPATVADRAVPGGMRHRRMAQSRPGDLGGPRRAPALRVVQAHVLGRDGPGRQAGEDSRRPGARSHLGAPPPRR